jgi:hypothetical protein
LEKDKFVQTLFYFFMELILRREEFTFLTLDIRGVVISQQDKLARFSEL